MTELAIQIVGRDLPGLQWESWDRVHVGVQRGREVIDLVPGDAAEARFDLTAGVVALPDDTLDFRGPYVHGKRGDRFLYLSWGGVDSGGQFSMFRRAKLLLRELDPDEVRRALAAGMTLQGTLGLTDRHGGPVCASVHPPAIAWQMATPSHT